MAERILQKGAAVVLPQQTGDLVHAVLYANYRGVAQNLQARAVCWRVIPQSEDETYWTEVPGPVTCLKCLSAGD